MKRPSFQFYPADWRNNTKLQRSTFHERGLWLEVMCLMHDSDEYGILRWPLLEIARVVGCRVKDLTALVSKGIIKGADPGAEFTGFTYRPRHAGKEGAAVTLVELQKGPLWFSSRMVIDEYLRLRRGGDTRFAEGNTASPNHRNGERHGAPPTGRNGERVDPPDNRSPNHREGNGATSSSSSSIKKGVGLSESPTRSENVKTVLKKLPEPNPDDVEKHRRIAIASESGDIELARKIRDGTA